MITCDGPFGWKYDDDMQSSVAKLRGFLFLCFKSVFDKI